MWIEASTTQSITNDRESKDDNEYEKMGNYKLKRLQDTN